MLLQLLVPIRSLSMCGQFLSKVVFLCSSAYEVPYFTTHGIVDSSHIEELKCFAIFTHIHLYISEETYDKHKWFLAWPQHNLQPVVRLPVAQRTRLILSVIVPPIPVRVWAAALPVVQKLHDALHQQMCIYPKQCKQYMQQQWCFATSMSPLHTIPCQLLATTYVKKLYKSKT